MISGRQKMWEAIYARVRAGRAEWEKQQSSQVDRERPAIKVKPKRRSPRSSKKG